MTDPNNNQQYLKPINDLPSQQDLKETPYYETDTSSGPVVQNLNAPAQYYNNPPPPNIAQSIPPVYPVQPPVYNQPPNYTNNYNPVYNTAVPYYEPPAVPVGRYNIFKNPRLLIYISIALFIVACADIAIHIVFGFIKEN